MIAPNTGRYAVVFLSAELMLQMMTTDAEIRACRIIRGLPEGTVIESAGFDGATQKFHILIRNLFWKLVLVGETIPEIDILIQGPESPLKGD